jgi:hypothetical protein
MVTFRTSLKNVEIPKANFGDAHLQLRFTNTTRALLYIMALGGHQEISISLNMQTLNLENCSKGAW